MNYIPKQKQFSPIIKNVNTSNLRIQTVHQQINPQKTPVKLKTQQTHHTSYYNNFDNFIKSPLEANQIISNSVYSKRYTTRQLNSILDNTNPKNYYYRSYIDQKKSYKKYNPIDTNQTKRSSSIFELRQTLVYIQQIFSDLIDKQNYALAKRYSQKLTQIALKDKIQKLIIKLQQYQNVKKKREKSSSLHKQPKQYNKVLRISQELKLRNSILQRQIKQLQNQFSVQKIKIRQQYEALYKKIYDQHNKIKKQLQSKDNDLDHQKKQHADFKIKYEMIFKNVSQQLKDIKTQYDTLKTQNNNLNLRNQQLRSQNMQYEGTIQTKITQSHKLKQQLTEIKQKNTILKDQITKFQIFNLKLKNCIDQNSKDIKIYRNQHYKLEKNAGELLNHIQLIPTCIPFKKQNNHYQNTFFKSKLIANKTTNSESNNKDQMTINFFQNHIEQINNFIQLKQQKLEQLQKDCHSLQNQMLEKQSQIRKYQQKTKNIQKLCLKYQEQIKKITSHVQKSINIDKRQKISLNHLQDGLKQLSFYVKQKDQQLKNHQIKNKQAVLKFQNTQSKLKKLQSQIQVKLKQIIGLKQNISQKQKSIQLQNQQLNQFQQKIYLKKSEYQQLQSKISETIIKQQNCKLQLDKVMEQLEHKNKYKETLIKQIDLIKDQMINKTETINKLTKQEQTLNNKLAQETNILLYIQLQTESKAKQILQQQAQIQANKLKIQALLKQQSQISNKNDHLYNEPILLSQKPHIVSQLQIQDDQRIELQDKIQILRAQIANSQHIITIQTQKIKENQQILKMQEKLLTGACQLQQQNKRLQENHNLNIIQINQLNFQLQKLKNQKHTLTQQLESKKKQLQLYISLIQQSLSSLQKLNQQMKFWQSQLQKQRKKQHQLESLILIHQNQLQNIRKNIQSQANQYQLKKIQLQNIYQEYQSLRLNSQSQNQKRKQNKKSCLSIVNVINSQNFSIKISKKDQASNQELKQLIQNKKILQKEISNLNQILVTLQSDIWLQKNKPTIKYQTKYSQTNLC